ncbi:MULTISPECIES: F0F1 ATP synthase subunit epsilon [Nonlabens]|uniref:ATP synthase epsilon chain n=2 Tax=Nonlabens TaxID=363408 RepID=A0A081D6P9_NONUL|nr:F0F1 ATP synthase subunit epsilon [Nonlabens ulvanivorans]KEZ92577.1 ATP synthase subunit delta [Nonlabens ulvanivorans]PRX15417.1 F-type H+-transporting ATPase subunit epsilon [Nonlabens ulvanivorans]WOI22233.1 F0F1 ATP synthase subunit epsilon [Nonlabens ulvanivorans]GAK74595.1 ATP synthase epsilon chain [Nonlabens ulvanivorans]GAK98462.1 ATP synthase epsilon chain [Nonlabens ulvanivorans]
MILEIVTPEQTLFSGTVESVSVPGISGQFQMLDNHAPVVSLLVKGAVKIFGKVELEETVASLFTKEDGTTNFHITGGVIEMKDNKAIVLAD